MTSLGRTFANATPALSALTDSQLDSLTEVVFSHRDGVLTTCAVFGTVEDLQAVVPSVPSEVSTAVTRRYAVDLESIGTDRQRYYVDPADKNSEVLVGYYFDQNNGLLQTKRYKRDGAKALLVDRYDADGNLISADEPEYQTDAASWTGPSQLPATAESSGYEVVYLKKGNAPQSYIRVYM